MELVNQLLARGERTAFRRFTRDDVDAWVSWPRHSDPLLQDYNSPHLKPRERDLWFAERAARPDHEMYAIQDADTHLIGRLFLRHIDRVRKSAILGVDLRSDRVDEGLGTDALRAFTNYFFEDLRQETLKLDVAAYNDRAHWVYEKLGWVRVGEHWNTYPSIFMPGVFEDPAMAPIRPFFRAGPGSVSVLHYDMDLTRQHWLEVNGR